MALFSLPCPLAVERLLVLLLLSANALLSTVTATFLATFAPSPLPLEVTDFLRAAAVVLALALVLAAVFGGETEGFFAGAFEIDLLLSVFVLVDWPAGFAFCACCCCFLAVSWLLASLATDEADFFGSSLRTTDADLSERFSSVFFAGCLLGELAFLGAGLLAA